jgi:hypothetical protein
MAFASRVLIATPSWYALQRFRTNKTVPQEWVGELMRHLTAAVDARTEASPTIAIATDGLEYL